MPGHGYNCIRQESGGIDNDGREGRCSGSGSRAARLLDDFRQGGSWAMADRYATQLHPVGGLGSLAR